MTKVLSADTIRRSKAEWEAEVASRAGDAIIGLARSPVAVWAYINHLRVPDFFRQLGGDASELHKFRELSQLGLIDTQGHGLRADESHESFYTSAGFSDGIDLHYFYGHMLEAMVARGGIIDITNEWKKRSVRSLLLPNTMMFIQGAFNFHSVNDKGELLRFRNTYHEARGIRLEMQVDAWHAFGESARTVHLTGRSVCNLVCLVRSVDTGVDPWVIRVTPLGIGGGFRQNRPLRSFEHLREVEEDFDEMSF